MYRTDNNTIPGFPSRGELPNKTTLKEAKGQLESFAKENDCIVNWDETGKFENQAIVSGDDFFGSFAIKKAYNWSCFLLNPDNWLLLFMSFVAFAFGTWASYAFFGLVF